MLLTITTTYNPATDIGYLLHKMPNRAYTTNLNFGKAHIFFPVANQNKCTAALLLDINPIGLKRSSRFKNTNIVLEQYVNDRPYVCSSFMSVALIKSFGTIMNGNCKKRPDLIDKIMPLEVIFSALPCRGGEIFLKKLFEPLGYNVESERYILDEKFEEWGNSFYYKVKLSINETVCNLLNHLYVLIPVLDNNKHYYIDTSEIDKLLSKGKGWLSNHPEKENIVKRYLKFQTSYSKAALSKLVDEDTEDDIEIKQVITEEAQEKKLNLNDERFGAVLAVLTSINAEKIIDLGCGEGKFLRVLLKNKQFKKITGMDVSVHSLEIAKKKLKINTLPDKQKNRIELIQGSIIYKDKRIYGYDAAVIIEVIEHIEPDRLQMFEKVIFEYSGIKNIIITTPNIEYNTVWENLDSGKLRHGDHRFEWTRKEFQQWSNMISEKYEYNVKFLPIGKVVHDHGSPTQMAVFSKY